MAVEDDDVKNLRRELSYVLGLNRELLMKNVELMHQVAYLQQEIAKLKEEKLDVN